MAFITLLGPGFDLRLSGMFDFKVLETRLPVNAQSGENPVLVFWHPTKFAVWVGPEGACGENLGARISAVLVFWHPTKLAVWVGPEGTCGENLGARIAVIDICMINIEYTALRLYTYPEWIAWIQTKCLLLRLLEFQSSFLLCLDSNQVFVVETSGIPVFHFRSCCILILSETSFRNALVRPESFED